MANQIWNEPIDRTVDWGGDESTGNAPVSGAMVQKFLKDSLDSKFGFCRVVDDTAQFFATEEDVEVYDNDPIMNAKLLLRSVKLPAGGGSSATQYYVRIINNLDSRNFATSVGKPCYIKFTFQSDVKMGPDLPYENTEERGFYQISTRLRGSAYTEVLSGYCISGEMMTVDVSKYLLSGENDVMIRITGETTLQSAPALTYGVTLTSLAISANNFQWWKPYTQDVNIPFNISGNIDKTLYVSVVSEADNTVQPYEVPIGKTPYTDTAYNFNMPHPGVSGVYRVSAYVQNTDGTIKTDTIGFNIICVNEGDTGKYIAINDVINELTNWSDNTVFYYTMYDSGKSYTDVQFISYKDGNVVSNIDNASVVTGSKNTFNIPLELDTVDNSNFVLDVDVKDTSKLYYKFSFDVDNSLGYSAMAGAVFYMNPKTRNNSQANKEKVINEIDGSSINATWKNIGWNTDGWSADEEGNKSLRLYAGSSVVINYKPFEKEASQVGKAIELDFCIRNVSDDSADAIKIMKDEKGITITPNSVYAYSQALKNSNLQGYNIQDGERIRLTYVIMPNAYGNRGYNLCFLYTNGVKNRTFKYESNDYFVNTADIEIGCTGADIDIYGIRVYNTSLASSGVLRNLINWETSIQRREQLTEKNDVFGADGSTIDFEKVRRQMNVFTFSGDVPSYDAPKVSGKGDLEVLWCDHPEWNSIVRNIKAEGQGTSSKKYWKWNLRWKFEKDTFDDNGVQLTWKTVVDYADGTQTKGKWQFIPGKPMIKKATAKLNWASSMQSHKIGSVNSMDDLAKAMNILNEANARISVYQFPFVGFRKRVNEEGEIVYDFLGLFTFGPDKGDADTFGYDDKKFPGLLSVEGSDNAPLPSLFRVPWNDKFAYDEDEEYFTYNKIACWDLDEGDEGNITSFVEAYNFVYSCSPRLLPFDGTLDELNDAVKEYKEMPNDFWLAKEDDKVVYYEDSEGKFVYADIGEGPIMLREQLVDEGYGLTTDNLSDDLDVRNEQYIAARIQKFRLEAHTYWDINDSIFHRNWVEFNAATDNRAKNTYPYTFGGPFRWRGDDMDTIWPINNQGQSSKGYWVEIHDTYDNGGPVWNGETSNFWNLLDLAFPEEVIKGMQNFMKTMEELGDMSYGTSYDKIYAFYKKYYFDVAQEYFPQTMYNETAKELYEKARMVYGGKSDSGASGYTNDTDPITQSLGDHYSAEKRWISKRIVYMMSKYSYGDFGNDSTDAIIVRAAGNIKYDITPAIWMYPCIATGVSLVHGERTKPGETCHLEVIMGSSGDQQNAILGASYIKDIGEWHDKRVTETMVVSGRMLTHLKLGHKTENIIISITALTISGTPALKYLMLSRIATLTGTLDLSACKRLEECYLDGTGITQPKFAAGGGLQKVEFGASTNYVIFDNMPLLTNEGVDISTCKNNITDFGVSDCKAMQPLSMLYDIYKSQSRLSEFRLKRVRCVGCNETVPDAAIDMLYDLSKGNFNGLDSEGISTSGIPVIEGKIHVKNVAQRALDLVSAAYPQLEITYDNIVNPTGFQVNITSTTTFRENGRIQLTAKSTNDAYPEVEWFISKYGNYDNSSLKIDQYTGVVTISGNISNNTYNNNFEVLVRSPHNPSVINKRATVYIVGTMINSIDMDIPGVIDPGDNSKVTLSYNPTDHTKPTDVVWSVSEDGIIEIDSKGRIEVLSNETTIVTVTASLAIDPNVKVSKSVLVNDAVIASSDTNPRLVEIAFTEGWTISPTEMWASEAFAVKDVGVAFKGDTIIESLEEFQYFGITKFNTSGQFHGCTNLKRIIIPETLTSVGYYSLFSGVKLDYMEFRGVVPNGKETYLLSGQPKTLVLWKGFSTASNATIGSYLERLELKEGVTVMPNISSVNLKYMEIPSTLTTIRSLGDVSGSSFGIEFNIAEGANFVYENNCLMSADGTTIYKYNYNDDVNEFVVPDTVTSINDYAFAYADKCTVVCHDNIDSYGKYAFYGYDDERRVTVKVGMITKGSQYSFAKSRIVGATDENTVTIVGAINNTGVFASAKFEADVVHMQCTSNYTIFGGITCKESTIFKVYDNVTFNERSEGSLSGTAFYEGTLETYLTKKNIGCIFKGIDFYINGELITDLVVPETVTKIPESAFYGNLNITSVSSIRPVDVDSNAFLGCTNLTTVNSVRNVAMYAFNRSGVTDVVLADTTSIGANAFSECPSLTSLDLPSTVESINAYAFAYCGSLERMVIPEKVTTIPAHCFKGDSALVYVMLPQGITQIGSAAFDACTVLREIVCRAVIAPTVATGAFGSDSPTYTGRLSVDNRLYVPHNASGYEDSNEWSSVLCNVYKCAFSLDIIFEAMECLELVITADDVAGIEEYTTIHWWAIANGVDPYTGEALNNIQIGGDVMSDVFGINPSYTETMTREISFTYLGVTATTTITQGVYTDTYYKVNLKNQWRKSLTVENPDPAVYNGVYESHSNHNISNSTAFMTVDIYGFETFQMYIRNYSEDGYDYLVVSQLDMELSHDVNVADVNIVKDSAKGRAGNIETIDGYKLVEWTNIGGGHHVITAMYRKDMSVNQGEDRGYILIPKIL